MKAILGQKIGMTRVFNEAGSAVPVTLVKVGPCVITDVKTPEKDGYKAFQISYNLRKKAKEGSTSARDYLFVKEHRSDEEVAVADVLNTDIFEIGDNVSVTCNSKGKGFTGVVKRYGFSGSPKTHGHKHDERKPGSIGSAFPQHVVKGKRMAGRSGNTQNTIKNLKIVDIDAPNNILALAGSVPGHRNTYVKVVVSK